jgi:high affinity choline transporter 7
MSPLTTDITLNADQWVGTLEGWDVWSQWLDSGLLLVFGGIPWQVYFQRVLSAKDPIRAKLLSYVAAIGCIIMAIPPVLIGAIAKATSTRARTHTYMFARVFSVESDNL